MVESQSKAALALLSIKYNKIMEYVSYLRGMNKEIYPTDSEILNSFAYLNRFEDIKVVIVGQDPYHGPGQAHGLAFSVKEGTPIPPSLRNIYLELNRDLGISIPTHGCLLNWAKSGVLLLNRVLTVERGAPNSHKDIGWEEYTSCLIEYIDERCDNIVFLLWGTQAREVEKYIKNKSNLVLKASHPSPLSVNKGKDKFSGCGHFSKANYFLLSRGKQQVDWRV